MMPVDRITSPQNPLVKDLVRLREGAERRSRGLFLVEGTRETQRALQAGWPLEALCYCPELWRDREVLNALVEEARRRGLTITELAEAAFAKIAYRENPDGVLAVARAGRWRLEDLRLPANPLVLVVEGVEKPGNLGALMRSAEAAGAAALVVCDPRADFGNPHAIRASQGACFHLPMAVGETVEVQRWLAEQGLQAQAAIPGAARRPWEVDLAGPTALILGTEDEGLTGLWTDGRYPAVGLPMSGLTDSLNVSAAAAVLLFEAVRQREARADPPPR